MPDTYDKRCQLGASRRRFEDAQALHSCNEFLSNLTKVTENPMTLLERIQDLQAQVQKQYKIYNEAEKDFFRLDNMLHELMDEFAECDEFKEMEV